MGASLSSSAMRILSQDQDPTGEVRTVSLRTTAEGTLLLRESTAGPLTGAVFGCCSRYHEVGIAQDGIAALESAHPSKLLLTVFAEFFASRLAYLSDLMDDLDSLGVAYSYVSYLPTGDAYFRPSATNTAGTRQLSQ